MVNTHVFNIYLIFCIAVSLLRRCNIRVFATTLFFGAFLFETFALFADGFDLNDLESVQREIERSAENWGKSTDCDEAATCGLQVVTLLKAQATSASTFEAANWLDVLLRQVRPNSDSYYRVAVEYADFHSRETKSSPERLQMAIQATNACIDHFTLPEFAVKRSQLKFKLGKLEFKSGFDKRAFERLRELALEIPALSAVTLDFGDVRQSLISRMELTALLEDSIAMLAKIAKKSPDKPTMLHQLSVLSGDRRFDGFELHDKIERWLREAGPSQPEQKLVTIALRRSPIITGVVLTVVLLALLLVVAWRQRRRSNGG